METESLEIKQAGPDFRDMVDLYLRVGVRNLSAFQPRVLTTHVVAAIET